MVSKFKEAWDAFADAVHDNADKKGFWDHHRRAVALADGDPELQEAIRRAFESQKVKLIGDELAELHEAMRDDNPPSVKAVGFSSAEEELADVIIRAMDIATELGLDVAGAMEVKHARNLTRPPMHGRKF